MATRNDMQPRLTTPWPSTHKPQMTGAEGSAVRLAAKNKTNAIENGFSSLFYLYSDSFFTFNQLTVRLNIPAPVHSFRIMKLDSALMQISVCCLVNSFVFALSDDCLLFVFGVLVPLWL